MTIKSEGVIVSPSACANSSASVGHAAECRFTCKIGYQLVGPGLKTCAQNTKWFPIRNLSCRGLSQFWYWSDLSNAVIPFFGTLLSLMKEQDDVVTYNQAIEDFFCLFLSFLVMWTRDCIFWFLFLFFFLFFLFIYFYYLLIFCYDSFSFKTFQGRLFQTALRISTKLLTGVPRQLLSHG